MPPKAPIQPWEWPEKPWTRLHIDHAGPVLGKMLLVIVDAHSKWIEAHIVASTSTSAAIDKLRQTFATHGLPETIVSDNDTAFTSSEFREFMQRNGIHHLTSAPYHPSSNGLAERAVQTVRMGVNKLKGPLELRLARFLFKYRVMPQATTGVAPSEMLMGRRLRTHLDLLYPTVKDRVRRNQRTQKETSDRDARTRRFQAGDRVLCRNFRQGPKWVAGTVLVGDGASVRVKMDDGRVWRRHVDHVKPMQLERQPSEQSESSSTGSSEDPLSVPPEDRSVEREDTSGTEAEPTENHSENVTQDSPIQDPPIQERIEPRRSTRERQPPDRLGMTEFRPRGEEL